MAADNPFNVNLPPVQWASGTAPHERDAVDQRRRKKGKKTESKVTQAPPAATELQFEHAVHEVDSFA